MQNWELIAKFFGIDPDPKRLRMVADLSAADRMRQMEKEQQAQWLATLGYVARGVQRKQRKDIPFVGGAKAGGWQDSLPDACIRQIESAWGELMTKVGYRLVTGQEPQGAFRIQRLRSDVARASILMTPRLALSGQPLAVCITSEQPRRFRRRCKTQITRKYGAILNGWGRNGYRSKT